MKLFFPYNVDFFTISQSNLIGLNGLGDRSQTVKSDVAIIQSNAIYKEFVYDTDFNDSVNTTATFEITFQRINDFSKKRPAP